jgi:hypothetical protein
VDSEGHPVEKHWALITFGQASTQPGPTQGATVIGIRFWGELTVGTFALGDPADGTPQHGAGSWVVSSGEANTEWLTDAAHTGQVVIASVDPVNHRVRGSFEFTGWSSELGTEVQIQRGAFEGAYIDQARGAQASGSLQASLGAQRDPHPWTETRAASHPQTRRTLP